MGLDDPHSLLVQGVPVGPANQMVLEGQEVLVILVFLVLLSLQSGWWKSHHLGLPFVLADQVDPSVLVVQGFLDFLGTPSLPLFHCNLALLWVLEVHPGQADLEVLVSLEILAIQEDLLFLWGQIVLEVHRYPSLLWVLLVLQVRGTLGLQAVR